MNEGTLDLEDIQGLIIRGYNFRHVKYIIFKINDAEGARKFCASLLPGGGDLEITDAMPWPGGIKPEYCLNIGLTYTGLQKLLINEADCTTVSRDSSGLLGIYAQGATGKKNAESIGDVGESAPEKWWIKRGKPFTGGNQPAENGWQLGTLPSPDGQDLHIQISLYTLTPADREIYYARLLAMIPPILPDPDSNMVPGLPSVIPAFVIDSDPIDKDAADKLDFIHFGYKDSISQPRIENLPWSKKPKVMLQNGKKTIDYQPTVPAYHFVIQTSKLKDTIPYKAHALLENGSFAAFRMLHQNVAAFEKFLTDGAKSAGISEELLAAKMCGRWKDGTPLSLFPDDPAGINDPKNPNYNNYNNFNYINENSKDDDTFGLRCPYGSHIRRSNPRNDTGVKLNDKIFQDMRRIVRRATPYGPAYKAGEPAGIERGLVGLFICANLKEQFQFLMKTWINKGGFRINEDDTKNKSGVDPLFGFNSKNPNHTLPDYKNFQFSTEIKEDGKVTKYTEVPDLEQFIRTDGGLYLFLPGIRGLRFISEGVIP